MMIHKHTITAGLFAAILLIQPGCQSFDRASQPSDAATAQQKARQEQLGDMSRSDAQQAERPAKKPRRPGSRNRLSRQRVVDQPGVQR